MTMNFENTIPLFFDADPLNEGNQEYVRWDTRIAPHAICFGPTGSGKSYGSKLILGRLSTHLAAKAVICTYKGGAGNDFDFLAGAPRFFEYDQCSDGLDMFYQSFQARQSGKNTSRSFRLLVFDEWAAYLSNLASKKEVDAATKKMATLLMLARSYNYHIWVIQQRCDSSYFATARDNFNLVIGLGSLSKESTAMFFSGYKEEICPVQQQGEGYLTVNGTLRHIQVPIVRDMDKLNAAIRQLVV